MGRIKDDGTTTVKGKPTTTTKSVTKKVVWSTKKVDEWMKDYSEGAKPQDF